MGAIGGGGIHHHCGGNPLAVINYFIAYDFLVKQSGLQLSFQIQDRCDTSFVKNMNATYIFVVLKASTENVGLIFHRNASILTHP